MAVEFAYYLKLTEPTFLQLEALVGRKYEMGASDGSKGRFPDRQGDRALPIIFSPVICEFEIVESRIPHSMDMLHKVQ